jgi:putative Mg2+ transporter-C (MgtC) family protein
VVLLDLNEKKRKKSAGIVTHFIVSLGATILTNVQLSIVDEAIEINMNAGRTLVNSDPTRIVAQVVSGIGYIGAGVILKTNGNISGVTTAATLWLSAILGIGIGCGFNEIALISVVLALILIYFFKDHKRIEN